MGGHARDLSIPTVTSWATRRLEKERNDSIWCRTRQWMVQDGLVVLETWANKRIVCQLGTSNPLMELSMSTPPPQQVSIDCVPLWTMVSFARWKSIKEKSCQRTLLIRLRAIALSTVQLKRSWRGKTACSRPQRFFSLSLLAALSQLPNQL